MAYDDEKLDEKWETAKSILRKATEDGSLQIQQYAKNLYTVSVWENRTEDVLEWNDPATSTQAGKINKQLEIEGIEYRIKQDPDTNKMAFARETPNGTRWRSHAKTGQEIYNYLSAELGGDKEASEFLLRAGIDGIKYPVNALSGGKGEKG